MLRGSCACGRVSYEIRGEFIGPGVHRFFASCCGSPIFKRQHAAPELLGFRLGTLDTDPKRRAELHFMVGSKAPWLEIHDSLRQEPGGVVFGERD